MRKMKSYPLKYAAIAGLALAVWACATAPPSRTASGSGGAGSTAAASGSGESSSPSGASPSSGAASGATGGISSSNNTETVVSTGTSAIGNGSAREPRSAANEKAPTAAARAGEVGTGPADGQEASVGAEPGSGMSPTGTDTRSETRVAAANSGDEAGLRSSAGTAAARESLGNMPRIEDSAGAALLSEVTAEVARMSTEAKVGQLLMVAVYDPGSGVELSRLTPEFRALFSSLHPGGVILFGRNIDTIDQTIRLIGELKHLSEIPLFVSTDQEGGKVSRLTASGRIPATPIPSAWTIGAADDPLLAYKAGAVTGTELAALGFNMDLAPDADVLTNPKNQVIGTRSFGSEPDRVARMVAATVHGLQDAGVAAVLKHFPGHGDTANDTHVTTAVVENTAARLSRVELVPFRAGLAAGADVVMTAHIALPKITGSLAPATLAPRIVNGILRDELGFQGVVMTDAMNMAAVADFMNPDDAAVAAIVAGCDMILRPPNARAAFDALLSAVRSGRIPMERLDASVRRILLVKHLRGIFQSPDYQETAKAAGGEIGTPEHMAVLNEIRAHAGEGK